MNSFRITLAIGIILAFQACGLNSTTQTNKTKILTEDNFVSLAKYHFSRKSKELLINKKDEQNNYKFRSYPGAIPSIKENKNILKITAVTPFNKYIESMKISTNDRFITIKIKDKTHVTISLFEKNTLLESTSETINKFKSFEPHDIEGTL